MFRPILRPKPAVFGALEPAKTSLPSHREVDWVFTLLSACFPFFSLSAPPPPFRAPSVPDPFPPSFLRCSFLRSPQAGATKREAPRSFPLRNLTKNLRPVCFGARRRTKSSEGFEKKGPTRKARAGRMGGQGRAGRLKRVGKEGEKTKRGRDPSQSNPGRLFALMRSIRYGSAVLRRRSAARIGGGGAVFGGKWGESGGGARGVNGAVGMAPGKAFEDGPRRSPRRPALLFFSSRAEPALFVCAASPFGVQAWAHFSEKGKSITKRVMRPGIVA